MSFRPLEWYRFTFSHRTRVIISAGISLILYTAIALSAGMLYQRSRDKAEIEVLKGEKVEIVNQITKDINLTLEKYKQEKNNE